jgi:hypothetical protein
MERCAQHRFGEFLGSAPAAIAAPELYKRIVARRSRGFLVCCCSHFFVPRAGVRAAATERFDSRSGRPMNPADRSPPFQPPSETTDHIDEAALAEVMRVAPLGAGVLAGSAVALLVLGYLAIYLLVFLPRGPVG